MTKQQMPEMLGVGLYSPAEAARLTHLTPSRVRRWIKGYSYLYPTKVGIARGSSGPVITSDLPPIASQSAISFLELVEMLVVSAFLKRGVSLHTIRLAAVRAAKKLDTPHPFAFKKFKTDGKGIFLEFVQQHNLLELSKAQYAFPEVLDKYLEQIDFDQISMFAERWWPLGKEKHVVVDPKVAFGKPILVGTRVPIETIKCAIRAGETEKSICRWFDLGSKQVRDAISFIKWESAA